MSPGLGLCDSPEAVKAAGSHQGAATQRLQCRQACLCKFAVQFASKRSQNDHCNWLSHRPYNSNTEILMELEKLSWHKECDLPGCCRRAWDGPSHPWEQGAPAGKGLHGDVTTVDLARVLLARALGMLWEEKPLQKLLERRLAPLGGLR